MQAAEAAEAAAAKERAELQRRAAALAAAEADAAAARRDLAARDAALDHRARELQARRPRGCALAGPPGRDAACDRPLHGGLAGLWTDWQPCERFAKQVHQQIALGLRRAGGTVLQWALLRAAPRCNPAQEPPLALYPPLPNPTLG